MHHIVTLTTAMGVLPDWESQQRLQCPTFPPPAETTIKDLPRARTELWASFPFSAGACALKFISAGAAASSHDLALCCQLPCSWSTLHKSKRLYKNILRTPDCQTNEHKDLRTRWNYLGSRATEAGHSTRASSYYLIKAPPLPIKVTIM